MHHVPSHLALVQIPPCYHIPVITISTSNLALVQVAMDLWKGKHPADMSSADVDAAKFDIGRVGRDVLFYVEVLSSFHCCFEP